MNTLSINSSRPLITRFVWKEYRMLRGLWLACFLIGLFVQVIPYLLWSGTLRTDPDGGFLVAWVAASLYSVGAAITMFCAETEDRTREYLRLLPGDSAPIIATKLIMAFITAVVLGCVLSLTSWFLADYTWADTRHAELAFALGGVGVVEGLAWGLLFSLWWKQPLLAAVAAIACASLGTQVAILGTTESNDAFSLEAYRAAVPGRLLISLAVLILDSVLASQWLYPRRKHEGVSRSAMAIELPASNTHARVRTAAWPKTKMFTRLLWQTWRESWKTILAAVAISAVLMTALMLPAYIQSTHDFIKALPFVSLISPALLGALAFRADQQRDHRLFLATHAAKPRYVWLARHVVWFGVVLLLGLVAHYVFWEWLIDQIKDQKESYSLNDWAWFSLMGRDYRAMDPPEVQAWRMSFLLRSSLRGIATAWCAIVAAYGIGQLCSMLIRQSLLSGLLAVLLAIVVAAWSVLMFLWEMNPFAFVLPIGLSAILATFLRAPEWLLQKNRWKHWIGPTMAIVLPLIALVSAVPIIRNLQVKYPTTSYAFLREPLETSLQKFAELEKNQQQTKRDIELVSIQPSLSIEEVTINGKSLEDYQLTDRAFELYGTRNRDSLTSKDVRTIERFQAAQQQNFYKKNRTAIPELVKILDRPGAAIPFGIRYDYASHIDEEFVQELAFLLAEDAERLTKEGSLDEAWHHLLAVVPLMPQLFWETDTRINRLGRDDFYKAVLNWATHDDQTSKRLKESIIELEQRFAELPTPSDKILFYRNFVEKILTGQEVAENFGNTQYYLLNSLPGERERALVSLDRFTLQALNYAAAMEALMQPKSFRDGTAASRVNSVRDLLRAAPNRMIFVNNDLVTGGDGRSAWANDVAATSATSFLTAEQFGHSGEISGLLKSWVADETSRRGLLVQLALIAYKLDHQVFPENLAKLSPDYLSYRITVDPYSGTYFSYQPDGLEYDIKKPIELSAHTPFFWSVGIGNMHLVTVDSYQTSSPMVEAGMLFSTDSSEGSEIGEQTDEPYFEFQNTEYHFGYGWLNNPRERLVFPLPKIDDAEDAETDESDAQ